MPSKRKVALGLAVILLSFGLFAAHESHAALVKSDFLVANDGLIVTDTTTGIVWLSPFYTRGQSYNAVVGGFGSLLTTHGFQFATPEEVRAMISDNFNNPPLSSSPTVAGFTSATQFF